MNVNVIVNQSVAQRNVARDWEMNANARTLNEKRRS